MFEDITDDEDQSAVTSRKQSNETISKPSSPEKHNHVTPKCSQDSEDTIESKHSVIVTNPSVDMTSGLPPELPHSSELEMLTEEQTLDTLDCLELHGSASPARSACVSPASSNGGIYSVCIFLAFYIYVVLEYRVIL